MPQDYLGLLVYPLVVIIFPVGLMIVSRIIRAKPPQSAMKREPYECGIPTSGETWVRFPVAYYLYALIYLIFAVEVVFLFPVGIALQRLGLFEYFAALIFMVLLVDGLIYAWKKGALEWK